MSVNLQTYGVYLKTAILAQANILAAGIPVYLIDNPTEDIDKWIKDTIGTNLNIIIVRDLKIADKVQKYSGQKQYFVLNATIDCAVQHGVNLSMTNNDTAPAMETLTNSAIDINTLAYHVATKLDYNKLTSDYLEYGGEITGVYEMRSIGNSIHVVTLTHEGRLKD